MLLKAAARPARQNPTPTLQGNLPPQRVILMLFLMLYLSQVEFGFAALIPAENRALAKNLWSGSPELIPGLYDRAYSLAALWAYFHSIPQVSRQPLEARST